MSMSPRLTMALAAGALLIPVCAWQARAQPVAPGQEGELGKLLPPVHDRQICFARTYDAAHLKRHPKQKVTAMLFQIRYHRHDPDETSPDGQRNYYFGMAAKVKGQRKTLYASGECTSDGENIYCGIDCDGGGVAVRRDARSGALIVSLEDAQSYLRMSVGCGEDETVDLTPGADDKVFRLDKASLSACRSLNDKM